MQFKKNCSYFSAILTLLDHLKFIELRFLRSRESRTNRNRRTIISNAVVEDHDAKARVHQNIRSIGILHIGL